MTVIFYIYQTTTLSHLYFNTKNDLHRQLTTFSQKNKSK